MGDIFEYGDRDLNDTSIEIIEDEWERKCTMSKSDVIEIEGKVVEKLPNALFKVKLENDHIILCHLSGKLRQNFIRVLPGDSVTVELSPYDLTKGRITWRSK